MKIAIIGAGLAGLTAAYELRDHEVDVFEADDRIGGKLRTVAFNDGPVDMGAAPMPPTFSSPLASGIMLSTPRTRARRFTPVASCTPCPPRQSWGFLQPLMPLRD